MSELQRHGRGRFSLPSISSTFSENLGGDPVLDRPSLQLHDLEGRIHRFEGLLSRKIKKAKLKNCWKKRWFRVSPDVHQRHLYHLKQSKSTKKNRLCMNKLVIQNIPRNNPSILVSPLSKDSESHDYTGFVICDSNTSDTLGIFRADDIVQQRNFMTALGGSGPGLFTQNSDDKVEEEKDVIGVNQTDHTKECGLLERQLTYDSLTNNCKKCLPSYEWSIQHLPGEFYFSRKRKPSDHPEFQGTELPVYDPFSDSDRVINAQPLTHHRRKVEDTFLPPHGPPIYHPISIGYVKEAGLEKYQHAIWDQENTFYYFLDHSAKVSYIEDPRSLAGINIRTEVKKVELDCVGEAYSLDSPLPAMSVDLSTIKQAAERASQKPHAVTIKGFGRNGSPGTNGSKGRNGLPGRSGEWGVKGGDGKNGEDGMEGEKGKHGSNGEDGGNGNNFILNLNGNASILRLCINGICNVVANLGGENNEEVVFLDCHGGDGGKGGEGGVGGDGGNGGDGGKGGKNGDGGHGGDGGAGGDGCDGGAGGKAASGGSCIIKASDPCLMMLVEVDCRVGNAGIGGTEGRGGGGGRRGYGGDGGMWEEADLSLGAVKGSVKTVSGMRGKPGSTGRDGLNGRPGNDSPTQGNNGGLLWVIESPSGEVLLESEQRYDVRVTSFVVSPDVDTFQPNQTIEVSEVVVLNSGGLPLPKGAKLFFPNTKTVRFEKTIYELPELSLNESFTVPVKFNGRIFDQSTPNLPGYFSSEANFMPRIELLGRPFEMSFLQNLHVSYPVMLSFALSRRNISRGDISVLEVGIENTSRVSYGSTSGSAGSLAVRLHLDSRLIPLGIQCSLSGADKEALPFRLTHDPKICDSMWIEIKELGPEETLTIPLAFMMDPNAQFCDICVWQSDLYFKGKLVEYKTQEVRVTPAYDSSTSPTELGDVLMITSDLISGTEFALWNKIFEILHLNVDYWDASNRDTPMRPESERSNLESPAYGASSTSSSPTERIRSPLDNSNLTLPPSYSMYAGKTILYPHCNLEQFPAEQILSHFGSSPSSNMLLFLAPTTPNSLEDYFYDHVGHTRILRHLSRVEDRVTVSKDSHSGYHILSPGTLVPADVAIKKSEKNIIKKLEREVPSQAPVLFGHKNNINKKNMLKYTYGSMDIRKCPILRSCNFQCVDGTGGSLTSMGSDDPLLTVASREFPLASKFGQIFLAVLVSVPLRCKLGILKNIDDKTSQRYVKCHLPNGSFLEKQELAAIAIAHEVADEILDCSGTTHRMALVVEDLQTNVSMYSRSALALTVNKMLYLIQQEVLERAEPLSTSPRVQSALRIIMEHCKSLEISLATRTLKHFRPEIIRFNSLLVTQSTSNYKGGRTFSYPLISDKALSPSYYNSVDMFNRRKSQDFLATSVHTSMLILKEKGLFPPLRVLQDSIHILRSHQLRADDDCYDIS